MVRLVNCDPADLAESMSGKKLVCFGAGHIFDLFYRFFGPVLSRHCIECIIDNDDRLSGTFRHIDGMDIPVITCQEFLARGVFNQETCSLVITNVRNYEEIIDQMDQEPLLDGLECYLYNLLIHYYDVKEFSFTKGTVSRIPKKIHYCWFGGTQIPVNLQNYITSWSRICPEYEIIRWDETNYDMTANPYMHQAYMAGKFGFVPDYARLDIIYRYGGIYLDTDVEIIRSFDDLLYDEMFCGLESNFSVNLGQGFGAVAGHPLVKAMRDDYEGHTFIKEDGTLNLTASPAYQTETIKKMGFTIMGAMQKKDGITIYPAEVLCPENSTSPFSYFTKQTHSIHHFDASWQDADRREAVKSYKIRLEEILRKHELKYS